MPTFAQNLVIDRVCRNNLHLPDAICSDLDSHKEYQELVQKDVTVINMYSNILGSVPGVVISLFAGPWSDTNGRKMLMILPTVRVDCDRDMAVVTSRMN